jgi:SAM-dependent methyltransferase
MASSLARAVFARLAPHFGHPRGPLGWIAGRVMLARNAATNAWLVDVAAPEPDETLVDLGCGPGLAVGFAAARLGRGRAVGVERAPVLARMARRRLRREILDGRADVVVADACALPLPDHGVDVVVSLNAYGHWGELPPVAAEITRGARTWRAGTARLPDPSATMRPTSTRRAGPPTALRSPNASPISPATASSSSLASTTSSATSG